MKKLLLASVLAIASTTAHAQTADSTDAKCSAFATGGDDQPIETKGEKARYEQCMRAENALDACDKRFKAGELQPGPEIGACYAKATNNRCDGSLDGSRMQVCTDWVDDHPPAPARVTVAPPYQGPPPIGWVYGPYTQCADPPRCSMGMVNVPAAGLNVRTVPNGYPVIALVNGTPLYPMRREGDWLLVAPACDLTPTWAWSWNAGVPLNRCWVYF